MSVLTTDAGQGIAFRARSGSGPIRRSSSTSTAWCCTAPTLGRRFACGSAAVRRREESVASVELISADEVRRHFFPALPIIAADVCHASTGLSVVLRTCSATVSYTHLRAHETPEHLVCR